MDTQTPPTETKDSIARGIIIAVLLHVVGLPLVGLAGFLIQVGSGARSANLGMAVTAAALNFGFAQLPYIVPAAIYLRLRKRPRTCNGVLLAGGIGLLLTAGCWGLVMWSM